MLWEVVLDNGVYEGDHGTVAMAFDAAACAADRAFGEEVVEALVLCAPGRDCSLGHMGGEAVKSF